MAMRVQTRVARAGGATSRWCLGFGLALAILFLSGCAAQAAGEDDDVSTPSRNLLHAGSRFGVLQSAMAEPPGFAEALRCQRPGSEL